MKFEFATPDVRSCPAREYDEWGYMVVHGANGLYSSLSSGGQEMLTLEVAGLLQGVAQFCSNARTRQYSFNSSQGEFGISLIKHQPSSVSLHCSDVPGKRRQIDKVSQRELLEALVSSALELEQCYMLGNIAVDPITSEESDLAKESRSYLRQSIVECQLLLASGNV